MANNYYKRKDLQKILNTCVEKYENEFGKPDKTVDSFVGYKDLYGVVSQSRIYQKAKRFIIVTDNKLYVIPFGKIIGYELNNLNQKGTPLHSATTTTIKTDTGDMIKRAVIGGIVAGGVGAIIGGTTAKKYQEQSEAQKLSDMMGRYIASIPNYELTIQVDDIYSPTIKIPFESDKRNAEEFSAILNVIIKRNAEDGNGEEAEIVKSSPAIRDTGKTLGLERTNPKIEMNEKRKKEQEEKQIKDGKGSLLAVLFIIVGVLFLIWVLTQ